MVARQGMSATGLSPSDMMSLLKGLEHLTNIAGIAGVAKAVGGKVVVNQITSKSVNNGFFEVITEVPISGTSRSAHRLSANKSLANELSVDADFALAMNKLFGKDVLQHMKSGVGVLKNPPGTHWHHPKNNFSVMLLLRTEVHQDKSLQNYLHKDGTGGFADYF